MKAEYKNLDVDRLPRRVSSGNVKWTKSLTLNLIELYKHFADIWDSSSPKYSDRPHRQRTMKKIAEIMQIDVRDVASKLHNLRCQFNSEIRKIKRAESNNSASEYTPRWEFFNDLIFLKNCTNKQPSSDEPASQTDNMLNESNSMDDQDLPVASFKIETVPKYCDSEAVSQDCEATNIIITEDITITPQRTVPIKSGSSGSLSAKRKKAEKDKIVLANKQVGNDAVMASAMKTLAACYDSHRIFCDYVADIMRGMPERKCKTLKRIIQRAIVELEDEDPLDDEKQMST